MLDQSSFQAEKNQNTLNSDPSPSLSSHLNSSPHSKWTGSGTVAGAGSHDRVARTGLGTGPGAEVRLGRLLLDLLHDPGVKDDGGRRFPLQGRGVVNADLGLSSRLSLLFLIVTTTAHSCGGRV